MQQKQQHRGPRAQTANYKTVCRRRLDMALSEGQCATSAQLCPMSFPVDPETPGKASNATCMPCLPKEYGPKVQHISPITHTYACSLHAYSSA